MTGRALALTAVMLASGAATEADQAVTGFWISDSKKVAVELYPCASRLCGRIAWLAKPYRKSGELKRDEHNPNPALRRRGWCGIEVIRGLRPQGDGTWSDGRFYYPNDGRTYDLKIKAKGADELELRAYLGIPLFGKTETWSRPAPEQELACTPAG